MAHIKQIYANLCGTWTDVTNCTIDKQKNAIKYFDEELLNHEEGSNTSNLNMITLILNMVIRHIVFIQVKFKLFFNRIFLGHVS